MVGVFFVHVARFEWCRLCQPVPYRTWGGGELRPALFPATDDAAAAAVASARNRCGLRTTEAGSGAALR